MPGFHVAFSRLLPAEAWRRQVLLLAVASFISFTGFTFVIPFLPLYIQELGISDPGAAALWSGLIFGISPLLGGLLGPFWGRVADRYGYKRMVQRSLGCFFVLLVLMAFVQNVYQLFALRLLLGMVGGFGALSLALASAAAPRERVGEAIASIQTAQLLSGVGGPLIGGLVADTFGLRPSFFFGAALCGLAFLLITVGYQERIGAEGGAAAIEGEPAATPDLHVAELRRHLHHHPGDQFHRSLVRPAAGALRRLARRAGRVDGHDLGHHHLGRRDRGDDLGQCRRALGVAATRRPPAAGQPDRRRAALPADRAGHRLGPCSSCARPLLGLVAGGSLTLAFTLGSQSLPKDGRAAAFGVLSSAALLGTAISAPLLGLLAQISMRAPWFFDAALYGVLAPVLWLALRRTVADEPAPAARQPAD